MRFIYILPLFRIRKKKIIVMKKIFRISLNRMPKITKNDYMQYYRYQAYINKYYLLESQNNIKKNIRQMSWFCWCGPKTKQVIQEYHPISFNTFRVLNQAVPPTKTPVLGSEPVPSFTITQFTQEQTNQMMTKRELAKPKNQLDSKTNEQGFSISEMKKGKQLLNDGVFRKIQKSNYEDILKQCQKTGVPWKDPDFNYEQTQAEGLRSSITKWKRITEEIPNCTLMVHPIKPSSIIQGLSNDCYFLSAVAAIAERQYRIKGLFGSLQANKWGVYMCKLFYNGIYQQVVVDDYFPYTEKEDKDGKTQDKLYGSRPTNGTDIWVMVLEKCWAKLLGGYSKIEFRFNIESLWALTGSPILGEFNTRLYYKSSTQSKKLFKLLLKYNDENNYVFTSSVDFQFTDKEYNLASSHSYTVIGLFQTRNKQGEKVRLVLIRNPLKSSKMPTLPYSFQDSFWKTVTEQQKDRLQFWRIQKQGQEGVFFINWYDYVQYFTQICISQINDNAHYLYEKVTLEKGKPLFLNIEINEVKGNFFIYIVQKAIDYKDISNQSSDYVSIRTMVASVRTNFKNEKEYKYVCSKSYKAQSHQSNYFYIGFGDKLTAGKYEVRIIANVRSEQEMVLAYYSPNNFTAKVANDINDSLFVSKTLLNRAQSLDFSKPDEKRKVLKQKLVNAQGWRCIENIFESNICYVSYHIQHSSPLQAYSIEIDLEKDKSKAWLQGIWMKQKKLKLEVRRGEQVLIPYTYSKWLKDQQIDPQVSDERELPNPTLLFIK